MTDFAWREYLDLANELASAGAPESKHRAAVSRAYYAAFHVARVFLAKEQQVRFSGTGEDHDRACSELRRHKQSLGVQLDRLKEKRTWADYKLERRSPQSESSLALGMAKNIVNTLAPEPPPEQGEPDGGASGHASDP